jgi:hypothetical protein
MTNAQNRKRWAINQKKLARVKFSQTISERNERDRRNAEAQEFMNMFFGIEYTQVRRRPRY